MFCIIDLDSIVYASAGAAQHRNDQGELEYESVVNAYSNAKQTMLKILQRTGCNDYRAFLTTTNDDTSFRKKMFPEYKANRTAERPKYYQDVRDYLVNNWDAEIVGEIEADDAVCMLQHDWYKGEYFTNWDEQQTDMLNLPAVLVGIDKDLDQMPGLHYNYRKDMFYYITPLEGIRKFYLQMLTGDKADNIPRVKKGWREKDAVQFINACTDEFGMYSYVYDEIAKHLCGTTVMLTEEQDKQVDERIQWLGDLLYLKRFDTDKYRIPTHEKSI